MKLYKPASIDVPLFGVTYDYNFNIIQKLDITLLFRMAKYCIYWTAMKIISSIAFVCLKRNLF